MTIGRPFTRIGATVLVSLILSFCLLLEEQGQLTSTLVYWKSSSGIRITTTNSTHHHRNDDNIIIANNDHPNQLSGDGDGPSNNNKWRPTQEWIQSCVSSVEHDKTIMKPMRSSSIAYVLGDCIKMCCRCFQGINAVTLPVRRRRLAEMYAYLACPRNHNPHYRAGGNLDVVDYVMKVYARDHNYSTSSMSNKFRYFNQPPRKPDPNAIVLHLRLGDTVEFAKENVTTMLWQGGNPAHTHEYAHSIKSIHEYLDNMDQAVHNTTTNNTNAMPISTVEIRGGGCGRNNYVKSRVYSTCLVRAFRKAGYQVNMDLDSGDADGDFYFMAHAKRFIASTGGYSSLIGRTVEHLGGTVLGRVFDDVSSILVHEADIDRKEQQEAGGGMPRSEIFKSNYIRFVMEQKTRDLQYPPPPTLPNT